MGEIYMKRPKGILPKAKLLHGHVFRIDLDSDFLSRCLSLSRGHPEFVIQQCNFSLFFGHPEWWWICEKVVLCLDEIRCSFLRFPCMSLASVATQNLLAQPRLLLSAPFPPLLTLQKVNFYFLPILQFNQKSNSKIKKNFLVTLIQVHT